MRAVDGILVGAEGERQERRRRSREMAVICDGSTMLQKGRRVVDGLDDGGELKKAMVMWLSAVEDGDGGGVVVVR